jgi:hypothetical protein
VALHHGNVLVHDRITQTNALCWTPARRDVAAASAMETHPLVRDHTSAAHIRLLGHVLVLEKQDLVSAGAYCDPDLVRRWTRCRLTSL